MFLSRKVYDDLRDALVKSQVEAAALTQVNAQLNAHIEWMRVRVMQLEFERQQLIKRYMNVDIPVPQFESEAFPAHPDPNETFSFNDVGNELAAKLGIDWNPDGTLRYNQPNTPKLT